MIGSGFIDKYLSEADVRQYCHEFLDREDVRNKKLLFIVPDHTRTAPIDVMFRAVYDILAPKRNSVDFLIALGTHPPMSEEMIYQRMGITRNLHLRVYAKARFFNHFWKDPGQLAKIGTFGISETEEISNGLLSQKVDILINKKIFEYEALVIIGPVFPHEVVGFSGGNKYLFPGIAGQEIIDMFHWLGALITNPVIIGTKNTPVRHVVDRAAALLPMPRLCFAMVVKGTELAGLFAGNAEEAWSAAADLSDKLHILYKEKPFNRVLSCAPEMYDDLWTGGKCMYKLEPVVADGGELIIYAPHITEISVTHGAVIEKIGYHVRDYFVKQMDRFAGVPAGVMAHSTHVKGIGSLKNGVEKPRVTVKLATRIPPELCKKINLGYVDPDSIDIEKWKDREDEGILYVPKAGEMLYRLKENPWGKMG
ncbi:DUF2088 domain-containing protein [candidate division KSB1 bacterium]|nr:DUF2088 domain-containing protein [candidate division KSB1 bacterium]